MFRIALSLAMFLEAGDRHRLKLCANPGCGFAFLDTSTNNTRRWCFMRYCGNRVKARTFRQRRKAGIGHNQSDSRARLAP
jgi:predicted RNA-binding Zn ribbon-like protein